MDHRTYMAVAEVFAQQSHAKKRKVGAVIVGDGIMAEGFNGTPAGWNNACEDAEGHTLPHVIHAEQNALDRIARKTVSSVGATLYVTTAPCLDCAKRIFGAKLGRVYYRDAYRNQDGINFLREAGIQTEELK